ncbi:restriction endonuclease subunit S [Vibrio amylolyticus]|uniref:restriction endonuclease subunit S n=1 Tax=Vibrio amylolyticus TaxID=2847292 RepID=UPI00355472EB
MSAEQTSMNQLITDNIDIWTSTVKTKSASGRGSSKKRELYGVKKLRELILELAVRGKLVPQEPADEPASVLLERIAGEKAQLVIDKKIKKPKKLPELSLEEAESNLPVGWRWTHFINVLDFSGGGQPPKSFFSDEIKDGYVQLIQIRDLGPKPQPVYIPREKASKFCTERDVMVGRYGASVGKVFWGKNGAYNVALIKIHNDFDAYIPEFIHLLLKSPLGQSYFGGISRSAQDGFSKKDIEYKLVPSLSLNEQHRIVAKVDELMTLCDQLEQQTEASIEAHQVLVTTLLDTLNNSADADELMQNWARISEHFDTLFTTEASIDQLKQTILQLAVMGKLVPQDPTDEPATNLLERIAEEKAQLIKEKKIKKQKALPPIADDEKPFELPNGWEWSKLQDLCFKITDGEHSTPKRTETGHYLLSARNVTNDGIILGDVDYVPDFEFARIRNRCDPNIGDILISCSGSVGRVALVDRDNSYSMVRSAAMIRPCNTNLIKEYLALMLRSTYLQFQMKNRSKQSAQANLFLGAISNLVGIIPPLSEQERIVSKVSELLVVCDQLKSHIKDSTVTQLHLTDAIVEQVV